MYYLFGVLSLVVFYLISRLITGNWNPFAMARGKGNDNFSASLLQMIIFTMLAIFAYTTVFAARVMEIKGFLTDLPGIPENLMILMGISVVNAVGSRAIRETQEGNQTLPAHDFSSSYQDRDGRTDLVKIQMLVWTFIAVVIYLFIFARFMAADCFLGAAATDPTCPKTLALPNIDTSFLTLMGVSHGAYLANKFASQPNAHAANQQNPAPAAVNNPLALGQPVNNQPPNNPVNLPAEDGQSQNARIEV